MGRFRGQQPGSLLQAWMELSPMNRNLLPWLVTQRDLTRYLGRALRACKRGRVLFFF
jgi:hypothetical protein